MKIQLLEKSEVPEAARRVYDALEKKMGRVPNFFKMMAHKPEILEPFLEFHDRFWGKDALPPKIKELVYLRSSIMNGCGY